MPATPCDHGEYYTIDSERRPLTQEEVRGVCDYYRAGHSMEDTAGRFSISRTLVNRILVEQRVPKRQHGGYRNKEVTRDNWIDRQLEVPGPTLLERRESGARLVDLARLYGVSTVAIRRHIIALQEQLERRREEVLYLKLRREAA